MNHDRSAIETSPVEPYPPSEHMPQRKETNVSTLDLALFVAAMTGLLLLLIGIIVGIRSERHDIQAGMPKPKPPRTAVARSFGCFGIVIFPPLLLIATSTANAVGWTLAVFVMGSMVLIGVACCAWAIRNRPGAIIVTGLVTIVNLGTVLVVGFSLFSGHTDQFIALMGSTGLGMAAGIALIVFYRALVELPGGGSRGSDDAKEGSAP